MKHILVCLAAIMLLTGCEASKEVHGNETIIKMQDGSTLIIVRDADGNIISTEEIVADDDIEPRIEKK